MYDDEFNSNVEEKLNNATVQIDFTARKRSVLWKFLSCNWLSDRSEWVS
jgi:hypothetical protein